MATGGSSLHDDLRVVLLGRMGARKDSVGNKLLSLEVFKTEETQRCVRKYREQHGKKLTVVDTPGWNRLSVQRTPEQIKQEIIRSPTLCLPGPHALLLVLPISMHGDPLSSDEIKSASHHVELLSTRAWRHTIVLFVCQDKMDKSVTERHVQTAKKLLDNCEQRYYIFHRDSEVTPLLQMIQDMVDDNCGDFLIPQISYEMFEKQEEEIKLYRQKIEELESRQKHDCPEQEVNKTWLGLPIIRRRGSNEMLPPTMADASTDRVAAQHQDSLKHMVEMHTVREQKLKHEDAGTKKRRDNIGVPTTPTESNLMPQEQSNMSTLLGNPTLTVSIMALLGVLLGAVIGANDGAPGSGLVIGFIVGVCLAIVMIVAIRFLTGSSILTGAEKKPDAGGDSEKSKEQQKCQ